MNRLKSILLVVAFLYCAFLILIMPSNAMRSTRYGLNWSVISNGGGAMRSTRYSMNGTVAQIAIGPSQSTSYGIQAGYGVVSGDSNPVPQQTISVEKLVAPTGQVKYGDALTYTLLISGTPGAQVGLYDPLQGTTFVRFMEQPLGITHSGGVITGTLMVTPTNQITVSFVVEVGIPGTAGLTVSVTNKACVYPVDGTLGYCVWSDEVANDVFRPYNIYLPLTLRNH